MCRSFSSLPTVTGLWALEPASSSGFGLRRASGPEIFTFDPLPEPAAFPACRRRASRGHRKRNRRVLYPRAVRRPLPAEAPNSAKRLLFVLLAVVFCQVLMAEEGASVSLAPEDTPAAEPPAPAPAPAALEPCNLTSPPADLAPDLRAFLRQHPTSF
ncbi:PREDICTED: radiation-inducible immediate-early gene IEX-1 [Chinchilla lanigera]|uniref:Immediate early response 3 n=1 Tax=Chinchilla lanigera TaxID=34839 RepID=A0A8C2VC51_CHILA|nr:PREDICTED: radiation-inducible immediate-early gene IEX-1 [Chinchilla lanigera]